MEKRGGYIQNVSLVNGKSTEPKNIKSDSNNVSQPIVSTLEPLIFKPSDFEVIEFGDKLSPRIRIKPMYYNLGFSERPLVLGRKIVLDKLLEALSYIPETSGFLLWDVYRPRYVQGRLFEWMCNEVAKKYSKLTNAENYEMARKYMSPPSKVGDPYCPPHLSGGAVDLTLVDLRTFVEYDMGTPFDDCTEMAHSKYFEGQTFLSPEEILIKGRRQILSNAMQRVGFVPYQYEWWHFDIGDIFWSRITGRPVIFGPLLKSKEWPDD